MIAKGLIMDARVSKGDKWAGRRKKDAQSSVDVLISRVLQNDITVLVQGLHTVDRVSDCEDDHFGR